MPFVNYCFIKLTENNLVPSFFYRNKKIQMETPLRARTRKNSSALSLSAALGVFTFNDST
jgi:hypothetical protein